MPSKVTDFNGGVALTDIQDTDQVYIIRAGTDQFGDMELLRNYMSGLIPFDVTIPTAEVLTSFTTPVEIIPNPGAGKIAVLEPKIFVYGDYNSVTYATNINSQLSYSGGSSATEILQINFSADLKRFILSYDVGTGAVNWAENEAINFFTNAGNPTAGNSDIRFKGFYRIIEL